MEQERDGMEWGGEGWACTCYTIFTVAAGVSNLKDAEGTSRISLYISGPVRTTLLRLILFCLL